MKNKRSELPIKSALVVLGITVLIAIISDCIMYGIIGIFLAGLFLILALRCNDKFLMRMEYKVLSYTYTDGISMPTGMTLLDRHGIRVHLLNVKNYFEIISNFY